MSDAPAVAVRTGLRLALGSAGTPSRRKGRRLAAGLMQRAAAGPMQASVLLVGQRVAQARLQLAWDQPELQCLMERARRCFGYALCSCRSKPLKLQVRLREGRYHLAVWPQEGPLHESLCTFFRDELAEATSAAAQAAGAGAVAHASGPQARAPLLLAVRDPVEPGAALVSIRTLAGRLWTAASLCRWHPSWQRDWGRARFELLKAARSFTLHGAPAEQRIFIPRPYRAAARPQLHGAWAAFARDLAELDDGNPHVLVAPVRTFVPASDGLPARMFLRHLLGPIALTRACQDFLARHCGSALASVGRAPRGAPARPSVRAAEVVGFFSVEGGRRGEVWARAGWLLAVHPATFIPAASAEEMLLVEALVNGQHAFQRLLSAQKGIQWLEPQWLLRHVVGPEGRPVARAALAIVDADACHRLLPLQRDELARRLHAQGVPTWTWACHAASTDRPPLLPPRDRIDAATASRTLRQIAASAEFEYCYGTARKFFLAATQGAPNEDPPRAAVQARM